MLHGAGRIAGVFWSLLHANPGRMVCRTARVNGEPGLLCDVDGRIKSAQTFVVENGRILAVYELRAHV